MVHVHGAQAQQLAESTRGRDPAELVAVPIDVGKHAAMALVCEVTGELLARPFEFPMTMAGVRLLVERVQAATRGRMIGLVRVGVEAAGHYHQPLTSAGVLPADWQLVQVNPAQVAAQRQLTGRRRPGDRRAGPGGDQRPAAGRAWGWPPHPGRGAGGVGRLGGASGAAGRGPYRAEEPAARPGRPRLPRPQRRCLQLVRHQGRPAAAGLGSPTRPGWPPSAWLASSSSPPPETCRSWPRWPSGWWLRPRSRSQPTRPRSPGP
jgi:hypothetical protein